MSVCSAAVVAALRPYKGTREKKVSEWQWDKRVDWLFRPLPQFTPAPLAAVSGSTTLRTLDNYSLTLQALPQNTTANKVYNIVSVTWTLFRLLWETSNVHSVSSVVVVVVSFCIAALTSRSSLCISLQLEPGNERKRDTDRKQRGWWGGLATGRGVISGEICLWACGSGWELGGRSQKSVLTH